MGRIFGTRCRNFAESVGFMHEVPGGLLGDINIGCKRNYDFVVLVNTSRRGYIYKIPKKKL